MRLKADVSIYLERGGFMNKDKLSGFFTGLAVCAAALGVVVTANAAGKFIEVSDQVGVTINGVPFTPKDANGNKVPLLNYNGTIYAPVRAFGKAAGLTVDYDSATHTAVLETNDYAFSSDPDSGSYISTEKARELALADAGVNANDALFLKSCLDWENGKACYEVDFCSGNTEYDYELDACTGIILDKDFDCDDFDWAHHVTDHGGGHHKEFHHGGGQINTEGAIPGTQISIEKAQNIALERLPGATVRKCGLDYGDGRSVYELELWLSGEEYECEIDAYTGTIIKFEKD